MTRRTTGLILVALVSMGLWGCAATGGGSIGVAISETCEAGADPDCINVGNQYVIQPSEFSEASVENASPRVEEQQKSVDITLTDEGAKTLNDLSTQAMDAGADTRLLLSVGDEILTAVTVQAPLSGDQVTLALSPEDDPDAIIERIQGS